MIFCFTGTGNSLAVARIVARATDDTLVDVGAAFKYRDFDFVLAQDEPLGFVFPVYVWTTPPLIDAFVKRARFRTGNRETFAPGYCYAIITCRAFVGDTARFFADELLERQGINLDASFSVKSVGNCAYLYDPPRGKRRMRLLERADIDALRTARRIAARDRVHEEHRNPIGVLLSHFTDTDEKPRPTKDFFALSTCIGCGRCAEVCPTNTITLIEGSPRWAELGCTRCLACLHRCPVSAIQYGKRTERRGRYVNPVLLDAAPGATETATSRRSISS